MSGYAEEAALEVAVETAVKTDTADAVVIGWVVAAAYKRPHFDGDDTAHAWFAPSGQPVYATVGLLGEVSDHLRNIRGVDDD